jgi:hypothetical protein
MDLTESAGLSEGRHTENFFGDPSGAFDVLAATGGGGDN